KRRLLRVRIEDGLETDRVISDLMGKGASARFRFIMEGSDGAEGLDVCNLSRFALRRGLLWGNAVPRRAPLGPSNSTECGLPLSSFMPPVPQKSALARQSRSVRPTLAVLPRQLSAWSLVWGLLFLVLLPRPAAAQTDKPPTTNEVEAPQGQQSAEERTAETPREEGQHSDASEEAATDNAPPPQSEEESDGATGKLPASGAPSGDTDDNALPPLEGGATDAPEAEEEVDPSQIPLPTIPADDLELAEGLTIGRIDVTGNRRISAADVRTYLRLKVGEPFRKTVLTRDVRELWRSGFFDDIEVDLKKASEDSVNLRLHVSERPAIASVEFEGNKEISEDDLAEALEVKAETILSRPALKRAVQKIRDMYAEQGYFLAEASFDIKKERNNEVTIRFIIREHSQVSVRRVTFIGNEEISTDELRDVMFTGNPGIMGFGSGGPFRQDAFERDIAMISAMY